MIKVNVRVRLRLGVVSAPASSGSCIHSVQAREAMSVVAPSCVCVRARVCVLVLRDWVKFKDRFRIRQSVHCNYGRAVVVRMRHWLYVCMHAHVCMHVCTYICVRVCYVCGVRVRLSVQ